MSYRLVVHILVKRKDGLLGKVEKYEQDNISSFKDVAKYVGLMEGYGKEQGGEFMEAHIYRGINHG